MSGLAQVVDGDPDREGQRQRHGDEQPGGEELAQHGLPERDRQRHQQFDAAALPLLGPEAHGDGGDQEQVEPGVEVEERRQVRLAALVEAAQVEREQAGQHQEDDDEHVGEGRREVAAQFPAGDAADDCHYAAPPALPAAVASPSVVIARNTSSSRPASRRSCSTGQRRSVARLLMVVSTLAPLARERGDREFVLVHLGLADRREAPAGPRQPLARSAGVPAGS